jgi:hypothetical protein
MGTVGNIIFVILCSKLKNNPDEYIQLLNYTRNHEMSNWKNIIGFNSIEWSNLLKYGMTEEGIMNNCPDIMTQRPWMINK